MKYAASELQKYIRLARGRELPIVTDSAAAHRIIIALDETGELGDEGVDILAADGNLYITGGKLRGCMYGVYEFLERFIGWVFISSDNTFLNKNGSIAIEDGTHYRHIPVISDRDSQTWSYRFENSDLSSLEGALRLKTSSWKNRGALEKSEKYGYAVGYVGTAHSMASYYSGVDNTRQICYNDDAIYKEVSKNVLAKVERTLERGYNCDRISVAPMDNTKYCACRSCRLQNYAEKSYMGSQLQFVNRIAADVAAVYPEVHVMTTAYWLARKPPVTLEPGETVDILYCWAGCNNHPFDGSECYDEGNRLWYNNIKENEYFERWCEITKGAVYCWICATSYSATLGEASLIPEMRDNIRYLADHNVYGVYCEGYYGTSSTYKDGNCFDLLTMYLFLRCMWDPYMSEEDFNNYENEFLRYYYGDGWKEIREYIDMNGEATDSLGKCWANNCDIVFDCIDYDYYHDNAEQMFELIDSALKKASTPEEIDHTEHLAASVYWMCLCATHDKLESGTEAERQQYTDRYSKLYEWMIKYPIVDLDDKNGNFDPSDPTVTDPYKWLSYSHTYHNRKEATDPMSQFG